MAARARACTGSDYSPVAPKHAWRFSSCATRRARCTRVRPIATGRVVFPKSIGSTKYPAARRSRWGSGITRWKSLREDPEVEEAIVAIDSDPPPAAFVRSSPPSAPVVTQAVERGEDEHRDALVEYHEPPEVDPPPLTYAQVFNEESAEANIHAPRAVPLSAIHPDDSRPSMLPWALLILALGGGVALVAAGCRLANLRPWQYPR